MFQFKVCNSELHQSTRTISFLHIDHWIPSAFSPSPHSLQQHRQVSFLVLSWFRTRPFQALSFLTQSMSLSLSQPLGCFLGVCFAPLRCSQGSPVHARLWARDHPRWPAHRCTSWSDRSTASIICTLVSAPFRLLCYVSFERLYTLCIARGAPEGVFANDVPGHTFGSINASQQQTSESESTLLQLDKGCSLPPCLLSHNSHNSRPSFIFGAQRSFCRPHCAWYSRIAAIRRDELCRIVNPPAVFPMSLLQTMSEAYSRWTAYHYQPGRHLHREGPLQWEKGPCSASSLSTPSCHCKSPSPRQSVAWRVPERGNRPSTFERRWFRQTRALASSQEP